MKKNLPGLLDARVPLLERLEMSARARPLTHKELRRLESQVMAAVLEQVDRAQGLLVAFREWEEENHDVLPRKPRGGDSEADDGQEVSVRDPAFFEAENLFENFRPELQLVEQALNKRHDAARRTDAKDTKKGAGGRSR